MSLQLGGVVDVQSEDVVSTEEGLALGLQHKHLAESMSGILVALQAAKDGNEDATVGHRLVVYGRDDSVDFPEAQCLK